MHRQHDYIVRMVLIGSSAVGKSAVVKRFADNQYNEFYISTIGIDFRFKSVTIGQNYVKLQIWDTAGQERFKGVTKSYYNNADAIIVVFDVNDPKSFEDLQKTWLGEIKTYCRDNVKIYALCNKCDKSTQTVTPAQKKFLDQQDIEYFNVSAKTGRGINEAVLEIAKQMIAIVPKAEEKTLSMELRESHYQGNALKNSKQKKCC